MRLFHVSEESGITEFLPRIPKRDDLDKNVGLVWAINEECLPNFLTPRNCPRVAYHASSRTTDEDKTRFFSSPTLSHAVIIESKWLEAMQKTTLYLYEFDAGDFKLQDETAGYYVSGKEQKPINRFTVCNPLAELAKRSVEIRIVDNLWAIADEVKASTLDWSLCRMAFAQKRP